MTDGEQAFYVLDIEDGFALISAEHYSITLVRMPSYLLM